MRQIYPPHVQKLLDSLPPDQVRFQKAGIEFVRALRVLVGLVLIVIGFVGMWGLYIHHPRTLTVLATLSEDIGQLTGAAYLIICTLLPSIGLSALRR